MILTREEILSRYACGDIHIHPFREELVRTNSVDVRLGEGMFALKELPERDLFASAPENWSEMVPVPPPPGASLPNTARGYILQGGGFYLGTTLEEIGAVWRPPPTTLLVPQMRAKSTTGRLGLTVALCAGLGDVGYVSRWALEIRVVSCGQVYLPIGAVIAQVMFSTAAPSSTPYGGVDRYQSAHSEPSTRFLPKALTYLPEPA